MAIKAEGLAKAAEARRKEQAQYWVYLDGEVKHYEDARLGLMTHALHYGTGVFEGIRGYWNPEHEQLFVLRLREHYKRLQRSVRVLKLKIPISLDELCKLSVELVRKNGFRQDIYIRPIAFKSSEEIGVRLHNHEDRLDRSLAPGDGPGRGRAFHRPLGAVRGGRDLSLRHRRPDLARNRCRPAPRRRW